MAGERNDVERAYKYRAFISYSHTDEKWAAWLHSALETYRVPKGLVGHETAFGPVPPRIAPVFRDRDELASATDLGEVLTQALRDSACQIVICSPAAAHSHWVNEEILTFKRLGRSDRVFCVIVDGEPNASSDAEEAFPEALRFRLGDDGSLSCEPAEPIAADARPDKDGKYNAKLKILAGMLGVGLDALKQREQTRRQRRLMAVAAVAVVGMVVTTTLSVAALVARSEAVKERARAETEAETSQQVTNFLVQLFHVSDPSQALGNKITARQILDSGSRRIEFELQDQPAIQATLMDTMGRVYKSLGLYKEAKNLLERGLSTRRSLFGDHSTEVARSESNLGQVLGLQAQYKAAVQIYEKAIETERNAGKSESSQLASSLYGLAEVRFGQGDYEAAAKLLREAIHIQRPTPGTESLDLARSLDELGQTLANLARYDEAEPLLREALAMRRKLTPSGVSPDLAASLNNLAIFLYQTGKYDESEKLFQEAISIDTRLLGKNHPDLANGYSNLGIVLERKGEYAAAEKDFKRALDIHVAALGEQHPDTANSLNNLAFLYDDEGDIDRALKYSRRALAIWRKAYPAGSPEVAWGEENLAGFLVKKGDYATAGPLLRDALAMNQRLLPTGHPDIAITRSDLAVLLLKTDRAKQALEMAKSAEQSLTKTLGDNHWRTAWARALEGAALSALGRYADAEPLLLKAYGVLSKSTGGARASQVDSTVDYLVSLYTAWGRPKEAARYQELQAAREDLKSSARPKL